ncbi:MAG: dihydropyrimidinase [Elusimicrobia bacterium]|nr:dihydropyrimidinase [Elusimicrobiota bacterium]
MSRAWDLVVEGGTVVTPSGRSVADLAVSGGRIAAVGDLAGHPAASGARIVDASGMVVVPGGVDVHTHLDMPFGSGRTADDFDSGSKAALFGGTTTIIDFAAPKPGEPLRKGLEAWLAKAEGSSSVDFGFHMTMPRVTDKDLAEMASLVREGVTSFKLFTAYPGRLMSGDGAIFRALRRSRDIGALVCVHAENGPVIEALVGEALAAGHRAPRFHALTRPVEAEAEAAGRVIALAEMAGAPVYLVHLSSAAALAEVRRGRKRGVRVLAETCPQYLCLDAEVYERPDFEAAKFVMSPPLRPKGNGARLWEALAAGELQAVATDHCSFFMKRRKGHPCKADGKDDFTRIPNGAPGIGARMLLLWDAVQKGRLTAERFVEVTASGPARVFGLHPRKGNLAPGADADIVVIDPRKTHTFTMENQHLNVDYDPYENRTVHGEVRDVFLSGRPMILRGRFTGEAGGGRFLRRAPRDF